MLELAPFTAAGAGSAVTPAQRNASGDAPAVADANTVPCKAVNFPARGAV
jgi:hypothetical protein